MMTDEKDSFDLEIGPQDTLQLRIKSFILGPNADLPIRVNAQAQVAILKDIVKRRLLKKEAEEAGDDGSNDDNSGSRASDRYLRLICKGKLLAPDSAPLSEFSMESDDVVHAVLSAQGVKGGQQAALARAAPVAIGGAGNESSTNGRSNIGSIADAIMSQGRRRTGIMMGPGGRILRTQRAGNGSDDDDEDSDSDSDSDSQHSTRNNTAENNAQGQPSTATATSSSTSRRRTNASSSSSSATTRRMGFDRLRSSGLSRAQIRVIRTYFSRHVDRHAQQHPNDHLDEPDLIRRRLLMEDDWMSLQGPTSDFRMNLNQASSRFTATTTTAATTSTIIGTDRDFIWGFCLGFFIGFIMLLWIWIPTVSHKQKIGILTGISFSLTMNVFQQQDDDNENNSNMNENILDEYGFIEQDYLVGME
mmetsp:Transcript_22407/g.63498  ORF Transcript_22407/g.63498 Transcript_22407/m.63498 type:complete len:418 (+) Transcript_22407:94-1347(+)